MSNGEWKPGDGDRRKRFMGQDDHELLARVEERMIATQDSLKNFIIAITEKNKGYDNDIKWLYRIAYLGLGGIAVLKFLRIF